MKKRTFLHTLSLLCLLLLGGCTDAGRPLTGEHSGIVSGITMVFVPSISTFYISQKLGGGTFELIGDTIERQFQSYSTYNIGAAISLVMMILILISLAIMNRFSDGEETAGRLKR